MLAKKSANDAMLYKLWTLRWLSIGVGWCRVGGEQNIKEKVTYGA